MDEIIILDPTFPDNGAFAIAERIRDALEEQKISDETSNQALMIVLQDLARTQGFEGLSIKFIGNMEEYLKRKGEE